MSRPHRCIECGEPHDGTHPKCGDCIIDPVIRRYAQERASEPIEPPKAAPRTARDRLLDRVRGLARIWTEEDPVPQSYLEELDTMERDMAAMGAFMDADFNRFRRDLVNLNRHRAFSAMLEIEAALKAVEPPL